MDDVLPGCISARRRIANNRRAPCRADNVVISAYGFQGPRAFVISAAVTSGVGGSEEGRTTEEENSGRSCILLPLSSIPTSSLSRKGSVPALEGDFHATP